MTRSVENPRRGAGASAPAPAPDARAEAWRLLRRRLRRLAWLAVPVACLLIAHQLALGSLDGSVLVAKLLAPNPSEAARALVIATSFLLLRIFVIAFLPGLLLATVGVGLVTPLARLVRALRAERTE
jgi:hypothetical protein